MRIVFAIKSMNVEGGGAERVISEVASGLAKLGHEIILLTFDRPNGRTFYSLHPSIKRVYVSVGDPRQSAGAIETFQRIRTMRKLMKELRPDIAVGFMHSMFIPMGLALLGLGIPLVASEHIVPNHYKSRPLQALLLLLTPLFAKRITVVSEQVRESYPSILKAHMTVVPNPVNVMPSSYANAAGQPKERKILLTVGRLSVQKDHASLIEAFAEIAGEVPDWDLRIVGEGELRGRLEAQICKLGLEERVQLPGIARDISSEYASAHLFVMSSLYESFGLATAEAMAHKLPAVGFIECQGTNLLIKSGVNGMLVEGGEHRIGPLAKTLKRLMQNDSLRQRMAQARVSLPIDSLEKVLNGWHVLIKDILTVNGVNPSTRSVNSYAEEMSLLIQEVADRVSASYRTAEEIVQQDNFMKLNEYRVTQFADDIKSASTFINEVVGRINVLALNSTLETIHSQKSTTLAPIVQDLNMLIENTLQTTNEIEQLIRSINRANLKNSNSMDRLKVVLSEMGCIVEKYECSVNDVLTAIKTSGDEKTAQNSYQTDAGNLTEMPKARMN